MKIECFLFGDIINIMFCVCVRVCVYLYFEDLMMSNRFCAEGETKKLYMHNQKEK